MNVLLFPLGFVTDTDFAGIVGTIRALENRFLDREEYDRILQAADDADVLRILEVAGYATALAEGETFETVITRTAARLDTWAAAMLPAAWQWFGAYFKADTDFTNLKLSAKAARAGGEGEPVFAEGGTVPAGIFRSNGPAILGPRLPSELRDVLAAYAAADREGQFAAYRDIDLFFDARRVEYTSRLLHRTGSPFLQTLARVQADCLNIRVMFRTLASRTPAPAGAWVTGGLADVPALAARGGEKIAVRFYATPYFRCVQTIEDAFREHNDMRLVEAEVSRFIGDLLADTRYTAFGPEVLVAYHAEKKMEIMTTKTILLARRNGLDRQAISVRSGLEM